MAASVLGDSESAGWLERIRNAAPSFVMQQLSESYEGIARSGPILNLQQGDSINSADLSAFFDPEFNRKLRVANEFMQGRSIRLFFTAWVRLWRKERLTRTLSDLYNVDDKLGNLRRKKGKAQRVYSRWYSLMSSAMSAVKGVQGTEIKYIVEDDSPHTIFLNYIRKTQRYGVSEMRISHATDVQIAAVMELIVPEDVQSVRMRDCPDLKTLAPLQQLKKLSFLDVTASSGAALGTLGLEGNLQTIIASRALNLTNLPSLDQCAELQTLNLANCEDLVNVNSVPNCPKLQTIILAACTALEDIKPLGQCMTLTTLDLSWCRFKNVQGLEGAPMLRTLILKNCAELEDLSAMPLLPNLQSLNLCRCSFLLDLSPLSACSKLKVHTLGCPSKVHS